uniref:Myosin light chain kinase, smooth muscle n=1 Tax=Mastacembelus armatus TaxID=205130 RepID=A0A7N8XYH4_9TELE
MKRIEEERLRLEEELELGYSASPPRLSPVRFELSALRPSSPKRVYSDDEEGEVIHRYDSYRVPSKHEAGTSFVELRQRHDKATYRPPRQKQKVYEEREDLELLRPHTTAQRISSYKSELKRIEFEEKTRTSKKESTVTVATVSEGSESEYLTAFTSEYIPKPVKRHPVPETERRASPTPEKTVKTEVALPRVDFAFRYEERKQALRSERRSVERKVEVVTQAPFSLDHAPRITIRMRSHRVPYGSNTRFTLNVQAKPEPEVKWFHNGKEIHQSSKYHMTNISGVLTLQITNCVTEDTGTYQMTRTEMYHISSSRTTVEETVTETRKETTTVVEKPREKPHVPAKILKKPQSLTVEEGHLARFECDVDGEPAPSITWMHEGAVVGSTTRHHVVSTQYNSSFEISAVEMSDEGSYTLLVENPTGKEEAHFTLKIRKSESKEKVVALQRVTSPEAKSPVAKSPEPVKSPQRVKSPEPIKSPQRVKSPVSPKSPTPKSPTFKSPAPSEKERVTSPNQSQKRVLSPPPEKKPSFSVGLSDVTATTHSVVRLSVKVTGEPKPAITWMKNEKVTNDSTAKAEISEEVMKQEMVSEQVLSSVKEVKSSHKQMAISEGQSLTLRASIPGASDIRWILNGVELVNSEQYRYGVSGSDQTLTVRSVSQHEQGIITCQAKTQQGLVKCQFDTTVTAKHSDAPHFLVQPRSQNVNEGQNVKFICEIAADPSPEVEWLKDNMLVSRFLNTTDLSTLVISAVKEGDGGAYTLQLSSEFAGATAEGGSGGAPALRGGARGRGEGVEQSSSSGGGFSQQWQEAQQLDFHSLLGRRHLCHHMDFKANLKGVKPKMDEERKVNSSQQVDFRAVLGKKSAASSNGNKPAETPGKNTTDFRSILANKKKSASPENNGEGGKMVVNNCVDGGITEKSGRGGGKAPEFVEKLNDVTVLDGQRLRLQCLLSAATSDPVTVTWTLDGKVIKPSKFIVLANEGGLCSLTIDKALPEDEGQYKCRAETSAGAAECCCMVLSSLSALVPLFSYKPQLNRLKSQLLCLFPPGEARIKKPTPKTPPKQALPPQILQFPEDMKILAGQKVEILCKFSGAPPISCTWLKFRKPIQDNSGDISIESSDSSSKLTISSGQQEHCGCYTIELKNSYGLRQAALNLTIVDKPDPPAKVPAASDIRRSSLTLSWYGPTYDGGSAVQSYNLEIWDSVEQQWKHLVSCNSTSYNVQNLLPERQYKFRVRAENIYGVGEPSAESEPVTVGLVDDDSEKEPDYRDVTIRTDVKVKELYDVEERLGTGKFGQVFKLVEKATKKVWAGKFIKAYSAKDKENVRQEIGIMNSLHHPKLVQCIDAFEGKSDIVMVLEMISGGELFERIIDEDFELTEREVIKYMLQIIDGVSFIHKQGIVHLDLKPENIMCVNKTGSKIKLIDFGLARRLANAGTLKVLFGTPEFVAPEVINYEAISYPTDMWSIGVICYILLSGLSPFMGDNDNETLSNVTSATWDFEDEAFDEISENAKDFITKLLKKDMKARLTCAQCFEHPWLKQDTNTMKAKKLSKERMKKYILRRKWQKTGHAVRAIGRLSSMAMLAGVSAKKGSPTEGRGLHTLKSKDNQFLECLEYEQKTECKPSFSMVIKDVEVVEGSAARFDCKIEGYPDPEVVWYKDDQPIKETRHFQIDYDEDGNCSLVISEVSGDDDAKYTVKAVNSLGEATCTAELLVEVMAGEEEEEEEEE